MFPEISNFELPIILNTQNLTLFHYYALPQNPGFETYLASLHFTF